MGKNWVFDNPASQEYVNVRQSFIREFLGAVRENVELVSALDVGCGVGYFSQFLKSLEFEVTAIDGRQQNVDEAQRRNPDIRFLRFDAEDPAMQSLGKFDVVLCFGLLYHLENPFRAIRNLYSLTDSILIIETMCAPGSDPSMQLLDEYEVEDQGLNYIAFYATESCLVKMLYRAGFQSVYRFSTPPEHEAFHATKSRSQTRTMLVGSVGQLAVRGLELVGEPKRPWDIWSLPLPWWRIRLGRLANIARKLKRTYPITRGQHAPKA